MAACNSTLRKHPVERFGEFGLGVAAVGRCQSLALPLAVIAALQSLAELFGGIAFHRPPHQGAQARRSRRALAPAFGRAVGRFDVPWHQVFFPIEQFVHQRQ